jgi:PAS domain S-box-containing protein
MSAQQTRIVTVRSINCDSDDPNCGSGTMARFNPVLWRKPPAIWSYGIAVLSVAGALIISRQPAFHLQSAPASLFLCAVVFSAWLGGVGPGLLAIILACLAFDYYFLDPIHSFAMKPEEIPRFVIFAASSLLAGSLSAAQRSATESLRRARDYLTETVKELQRTNEALQAESLERTQIEIRLRRSESYLAEAQRLSHTGSWARDVASDKMKYASDEFYRVLGFDPQDGPPRFETFLQRVHPEDQAKFREIVEKARHEKAEYETDYRIVHPSGEVRDIHVIGHPVIGPSGDVNEFIGTVIDITDRKRAEGELRRSEAYLAEAQRLTHTGSWAYKIDPTELVHSSEEHSRLFGFDPDKGVPSFEELVQRIHPEDRAFAMREFESPNRAGKDFDAHFRIVLPDGATRYVYGTGHPVFNAPGDLVGFFGTVMDITERKRAEEERERLREAQADLARVNRVTTMGELTASLAHEVNQPIGASVTNASTCLRWLAGDTPNLEEARAAAMRVVTDGKRAAEIISRVRQLFKKGTPERELVDVNEIVREMTVLLEGEASRHNISVRTELAADLPRTMGDRVQLQQVMMNLIVNSIDAMKGVDGARELAINSRLLENDDILVSVSDTGVGLPTQHADQIFNAFFTTKLHGTGMGLRISGTIVESHGGRLWAENNAPRGASFQFTLPTKIEAHE